MTTQDNSSVAQTFNKYNMDTTVIAYYKEATQTNFGEKKVRIIQILL